MLSVVFGLAFSSKIIAYAWLPAVFLPALAAAPSRGVWRRLSAYFFMSLLAGFAVAYLLDPGLHGSPFGTLLERLAWRADRIEIQQIVFVSSKICGVWGRLVFAAHQAFFTGPVPLLLCGLCIAGTAARFCPSVRCRMSNGRIVALLVAVFFTALLILTLPLAWFRYVAWDLPFLALLAGVGASFLLDLAREWRCRSVSLNAIIIIVMVLVTSALVWTSRQFPRRWSHLPAPPTAEQVEIARMVAFSLIHPGTDVEMHIRLKDHFERTGNKKRAAREQAVIEYMLNGKTTK